MKEYFHDASERVKVSQINRQYELNDKSSEIIVNNFSFE